MKQRAGAIPLLLVLALATDLLTPLAIWKGIIPAQARWISHAAIAGMIPVVYTRMLLAYGVPRVVCVALMASGVGVAVALLQGQGLVATAWGWWVMFQFPLVGLYAYLWRRWPERFVEHLYRFCIIVLGVQVVVQSGQYSLGQAPGDDLAGLFGWHGTGDLAVFIVFVYCLALGRWLTSERWGSVVLVLALGSLSSALGEMKLFPYSVVALSMLAVIIMAVQKRSLTRLIPFVAVAAGMIFVSVLVYDRVVYSGGFSSRSLMAYAKKDRLDRYLGSATRDERGLYYMGRNYALMHGWDTIRKDNFTLLCGFGLGARNESQTLGTAGTALRRENFSFTSGTNLLIVMQEMGVLGLILLATAVAWVVQALLKGVQQDRESGVAQLRYALLLFSLLWPLWFWYNKVLTLRVPMLLYWMALGYVLSESSRWMAKTSRPAGQLQVEHQD